jgi:geranylgeranyl reductase family protein
MTRDVVVAGGGPAGAALAVFLRRRGHDVLLLDAARFPRDKICGEGVSPEAWRLLEDLGAAARVRSLRPHALRGMTLIAPDGTTFSGHYGEDREPGFAVRRCAFDKALLDRAREAGAEVREGVRVTDLVFQHGRVAGVVAEDEDAAGGGRVIEARLVAGADGRRSRVARRLGLLREHPRLRKFAVRGHWEGVADLTDHGEMHVVAGGYCGVAPLSATRANLAFVLDEREMAPAAGDLEGFYRNELRRRWPRLQERIVEARLLEPPRAIGPLALCARRLSVPGALLVGDAAGFYDPFTGEGVTLALRSAEIAAEVAHDALGRDRFDGLGEYDRRRHEATRHKFLLNRILQHVVARPALSNLVARRLRQRPDLADQLVGIAGDFIPARTALGPRFLFELLAGQGAR